MPPADGKGKGGYSLSRKRISPFKSPKRKVRIGSLDLEEVHSLRNGSACVAALLRSPPLVLLDDLVYSYYPLPLCVSCAGAA